MIPFVRSTIRLVLFAVLAPLVTGLLAGCGPTSLVEAAKHQGERLGGLSLTAGETPAAVETPTAAPSATPTTPPTATPTLEPSPTPEPSPTATPEPSPTATPDRQAALVYEVRQGETAAAIARGFNLPTEALLAYNGMPETQRLLPGTSLTVPVGSERVAAMRATATAAAIPPTPTPARVVLPMGHAYQKPNNCAPATTSMVVNTYGLQTTQFDLAALQKPVSSDLNVTAEEVAASIRELGLGAFVGVDGDVELVQHLVAAGFPVITEEWMHYDGGMGHFRAIRGYDLERQAILHNDSYYGPEIWRSYDEFLRDWRVYNNKYVIAYPPDREAEVRRIVGADWDPETMYAGLLATGQAQAEANPNDPYAWWGVGEALHHLGPPEEALASFQRALATNNVPWRYLWYRYGYFEVLNETGRHEELLAATQTTLAQMGRSEDLRYHRAVALRALGRPDEARAELEQALRENPRFVPAAALLETMADR